MECQYQSKSELLQKSHDNIPLDYILGLRINDLPSLLEK